MAENSVEMTRNDDVEENTSDFCRICMEDERFEELIQVCQCKGYNKKVHKSCLQSWLLLTKNPAFKRRCYLCDQPYEKKYIADFANQKKLHTKIIFSLYLFNMVYSVIVFILFYQFSKIHISQICIPVMITLPYIGAFIFTDRGSWMEDIHKHTLAIVVYLIFLIIASYFLSFGFVFPLFIYLIPLNVLWVHKLITYHES